MKKVIFLGSGDPASLADKVAGMFNKAAVDAELIDWMAQSAEFGSNSALATPADLTIVLEDSRESLRKHQAAGFEVWRIDPSDDQELERWIKNLCVRLILEGGRRASMPTVTCSRCRKPENFCICPAEQQHPADKGKPAPVRIFIESKGRGGKKVTVIDGLRLPDEQLAAMARQLKESCGSGGTVKDGRIEIQGDKRDLVLNKLATVGIKAKKAGG